MDRAFGSAGCTTIDGLQTYDVLGARTDPTGGVLAATPTVGTDAFPMTLVRLTDNGDLDPMFGSGGVLRAPISSAAHATSFAVQSDGKIVIAAGGALMRLTHAGDVDTTFAKGGVLDGVDGNIFVGAHDHLVVNQGSSVARILADGTLDASFGNGGVIAADELIPSGATNAVVRDLVESSTGTLYVSADFDASTGGRAGMVARVSPQGEVDGAFGPMTTSVIGPVRSAGAVTVAADGNVLLAYDDASGTSFLTELSR